MTQNNILPVDKYTEIINGATLYITKKTVQFGSDIYQFHNVTGFGVSKIKTGPVFPIQFILALFILGLLMANNPDLRWIGILMVLGAIVGNICNANQRQKYGLAIYLNSGHEKIFITSDVQGLKKIVETLYDYMDSNEKVGTFMVNIVEGNVTGNFIGGNAHDSNVNFH